MKKTRRTLGQRLMGRSSDLIGNYYEGRNAERYVKSRSRNPRWQFEKQCVIEALGSVPPEELRAVADIPVGTNRFRDVLQANEDVQIVYGVDYSYDMMQQGIEGSGPKFFFSRCDLLQGRCPISADTVISFRFFNLFNFADAKSLLASVTQSVGKNFICTIRLSDDPTEMGTVYQDKIHIHSKQDFMDSLAANGLTVRRSWDWEDEKPGVYQVLHAVRT